MRDLRRWFDSVETDRQFETCKVCEQLLPLAADTWVVNKHFHRAECVLEYAVCETCRDRISGDFSESSKAAIRDFLESEIDWEQRMLDWMTLPEPAARMDHCVACRTPREGMEGFTVSAQFRNDSSLIEGALPLLMCASCVSRITESMSGKSREIWQEFISRYFEGPDADEFDLGIF